MNPGQNIRFFILSLILYYCYLYYYYYYCYYCYYYYYFISFTSLGLSMDSSWRSSVNKVPSNSRTFLMILALLSKTGLHLRGVNFHIRLIEMFFWRSSNGFMCTNNYWYNGGFQVPQLLDFTIRSWQFSIFLYWEISVWSYPFNAHSKKVIGKNK